jgi:hypothetical protein
MKKNKAMDNRIEQLEIFFNQYAERFNNALNNENPNIYETANAFADCFIEASPLGVTCGRNDEQFRAVIPQGYAFYKSIGVTSMDIISKETTVLDYIHSMTKVHWKTTFVKQDKSKTSIEFDVIYFTRSKGDEHKIFTYITGDEQKALKENGLV